MLQLRLQGYTFREISERTGRAEYVARRLVQRIRAQLEDRAAELSGDDRASREGQ
jgi:hypothetical protein